MPKTSGIFISHIDNHRIRTHYDRLRAESDALVDWHFARNRGTFDVEFDREFDHPSKLFPQRYKELERNGTVIGGFLDVVLFPCILALDADYTWILEYDVDFSGRWSTFFERFSDDRSDLLTTTITQETDYPAWPFWEKAGAPQALRPSDQYRAFHPIMRISRRFAERYAAAMSVAGWRGHYEYILPTFAFSAGLSVSDIGGTGKFVSRKNYGQNYRNTPLDLLLSPGTFVWRPSINGYFHESPELYGAREMLHHPVKADVKEWDE